MEQRLQVEYDKEMRNVKKFSGNTLELEFKHDELARAEKVFELIAARTLQIQTERNAPTRVSLLRMAEVPATPMEPYPLRRPGPGVSRRPGPALRPGVGLGELGPPRGR